MVSETGWLSRPNCVLFMLEKSIPGLEMPTLGHARVKAVAGHVLICFQRCKQVLVNHG